MELHHLGCGLTMWEVGEHPGDQSGDEDPWVHIEELKHVAQGYLNEHHHERPTSLDLPVAHWDVISKPNASGWQGSGEMHVESVH